MGTVELTVGPDSVLRGDVFSSASVDLSHPSQVQELPGGSVSFLRETPPQGTPQPFDQSINTTFDLRIYFGGPSSGQPYVELTGKLTGHIGEGRQTFDLGGQFTATPTSAVLHNGTADSTIPPALIDEYMHPHRYHLDGAVTGGQDDIGFHMTIDPPPGCSVIPSPEPATVVVWLAAVAALGLQHRRHPPRARRA
jgi:hypothetical protein